MRLNIDWKPGQILSFDEIAARYHQRYPDEKALTPHGLLTPATASKHRIIRAVFASRECHIALDDLLFIAHDNERKNYLQRFEYYLQQQSTFPYFRRPATEAAWNRWRVMGESRVLAMLDPASIMAQSLLAQRGYQLTLLRSDEEDEYWQLYDRHGQPCFEHARRLQFLVVLLLPTQPPASGVIAGTRVGRRVMARLWQRAGQQAFTSAVRERYGACVITGTRLGDEQAWPWVEACHVDSSENEQGYVLDNSVDNGLFLRSDLQRLYASGRLRIDARAGTIHFRRMLVEDAALLASYQQLDGQVCALWSLVPEPTRQRLSRV